MYHANSKCVKYGANHHTLICKKIDHRLIQETFLESHNIFKMLNFTVYRFNRFHNKEGGIMILVKDNLVNHYFQEANTMEITGIQLTMHHSQKNNIFSAYLQPNRDIIRADVETLLPDQTVTLAGGHSNVKKRSMRCSLLNRKGDHHRRRFTDSTIPDTHSRLTHIPECPGPVQH